MCVALKIGQVHSCINTKLLTRPAKCPSRPRPSCPSQSQAYRTHMPHVKLHVSSPTPGVASLVGAREISTKREYRAKQANRPAQYKIQASAAAEHQACGQPRGLCCAGPSVPSGFFLGVWYTERPTFQSLLKACASFTSAVHFQGHRYIAVPGRVIP